MSVVRCHFAMVMIAVAAVLSDQNAFASERFLASESNPTCGGFVGTMCPSGLTCIFNDPNCDPDCGGRNCLGQCREVVDTQYGLCGGFAGFRCPTDSECVDSKGDGCSPNCGGADCGGICVSTKASPSPITPTALPTAPTSTPPTPAPSITNAADEMKMDTPSGAGSDDTMDISGNGIADSIEAENTDADSSSGSGVRTFNENCFMLPLILIVAFKCA